MIVSSLPDPEQHPLWPQIRQLLKPAADYGEIEVLGDGEVLWVAFDGPMIFGAATTLFWDDGEAELRLAGGARHREWIAPLDEAVSTWARLCGAKKLTMRGRKGWLRYARRFGWGLHGIESGRWLYEKKLAPRAEQE